jgi:hypothetical protein
MTPSEIARGLSKAQREMLLKGQWPAWQRELRETRVKAALERKGLCTFTHVIAGRGDFRLSDLGLAVRAHLQENPR